jgi:hypothetical protein
MRSKHQSRNDAGAPVSRATLTWQFEMASTSALGTVNPRRLNTFWFRVDQLYSF